MRDFKLHLKRIHDAGIEWVRMDVKTPISHYEPVFREAHDLGLKIITVITGKNMLSELSFGVRNYFPGSGWDEKWKKRVKSAVGTLNHYVKIWQIDNELNHPWHNPLPWLNKGLALDILKGGIDAVKGFDSEAKVAVNLFFRRKTLIPGINFPNDKPLILKLKEELGDKIDILGMDIYRGTWHKGSPSDYSEDLIYYHDLWGKDIMIMETGYCTGSLGHTNETQVAHVGEVFQSLDQQIRGSDWFSGLIWYEYLSKHEGTPCEEFFGLHENDGTTEKPAWKKFKEKVDHYKEYNKIFGVTYHY